MGTSFYVIAALLFSVLVQVNSLQCYECQNCPTVTDNDVKSCGSVKSFAASNLILEARVTNTGPSEASPGITTAESAVSTSAPQTSPDLISAARVRREVSSDIAEAIKSGCSCGNSDNCDCSSEYESEQIIKYADTSDYRCFKVTYKENNTEMVIRGCTPALIYNKTLCEVLQGQTETCDLCDQDKCNGAITLHLSILLLLSAFSISYLI